MRADQCDSPVRRRRLLVCVTGGVLVVAAFLVATISAPVWLRWLASRELDAGALSEAQHWLSWSAWFSPTNGDTELMRAACFRRLGQMGAWEVALQSSRDKGASPARWEQERMLGLIRQGASEVPDGYWKDPSRAGLRPSEAIEVCVRGHLARNEPQKAEQILAKWRATLPEDAQLAYLQGVYWYRQGEEASALTEFERAVARQPRHELAHSALIRLLDKQDRLAEALTACVAFASRCPRSTTSIMELARVLRKLTRIEDARAVVDSLGPSPDRFSECWAEMGSLELELGNYRGALRWFAQAPAADGQKKRELQSDVAMAFAMQEEADVADRLFEEADTAESAELRASDLLRQLAVSPDKTDATDELKRLSRTATESATKKPLIETERARTSREKASLAAADLYGLLCSACHGPSGRGDGRAARHQFPEPRDLRTENFRLVSTHNGNPTLADVIAVLQRGMPGTSMRDFANLSASQLQSLAGEVLRLRREGLQEWYVARLRAAEEEIDDSEVRTVVAQRSEPGDIVRLPAIGPADPQAVARGRDNYGTYGCRSCHGDDGAGASSTVLLFDQRGLPSWPRNLVADPFKGGLEPESVCLRILAGMPGSLHPATKCPDEQAVDLVHFCGSLLSRQPKRTLTNHQRFLEATQRRLPSVIQEPSAVRTK